MTAALMVRDIHKSFGGVKPLNGMSFDLEQAKITGLIGPNGAGKTTLFNVITGFVPPDAGSVAYKGKDVTSFPADRIARLGIARTFQNLRMFTEMTCLENVLVSAPRHPQEALWRLWGPSGRRYERQARERAQSILAQVGLSSRCEELAKNLSYGELKQLALARILGTGAEVILLDELIAGVDRDWAAKLMSLISGLRDAGKTVCLIEHNLDVIRQLSDFVVFLDQGKSLASGTVDEILSRRDLTEVYFGRTHFAER